jgi:ankyrin repeat protein
MIRLDRKWLLETPLTPAWRRGLEMCLGVVLSGAVVVGLSSTLRPDPSKVAAIHGTLPIMSSPQAPQETAHVTDPPKPEMSMEMYSAVRIGDLVAMRKAYRPGMKLEGTLALAARSGKKDAVVWVLAHGADIHEAEHSIAAPILAGDAFPDIAALLRAKGVAEPTVDSAAGANAPNALRLAIAAHPKQAKESVALRSAAASAYGTAAEKLLVVTMLLDAGANPNNAYFGETALGEAVQTCGHDDDCMPLVRVLLDHGAEVKGDALGAALSLDDASRSAPLEALLERPIEKGVTAGALARATNASATDLARIVKLGVDWAWHDGEEDAALPLLAAVRHADRDYARALIDAGAPVDVHFKDGSSALAEALDRSANEPEQARIVELLVLRGANVNRRLPDGRTPLFAAAESGNIRVVHFLLAHGARVNDRILDSTALDAAEQHGNIAAARILDAHGGQRGRPPGVY